MDLLANSWLWKTGMQNVNYDQNQFSHYKRLHHGRSNQKIHFSVTWKLFMVVTMLVGSENNWTVNISLMQISTAGKQTHHNIWLTNKTTPLWTFCVIIRNSVPPVDLGRAPTRTFERYMNEHCREWIYNCKQLQSIVSRFCGHYCACYCILRSKGIDMCRFLRYFTRDTGLNDVIAHELMCNVYYCT